MSFATSYQELTHKIETDFVYSTSKEFKKDVVNYLSYVYYLKKKEAENIFKQAKSQCSEPIEILDFADEKAEEIYEAERAISDDEDYD